MAEDRHKVLEGNVGKLAKVEYTWWVAEDD